MSSLPPFQRKWFRAVGLPVTSTWLPAKHEWATFAWRWTVLKRDAPGSSIPYRYGYVPSQLWLCQKPCTDSRYEHQSCGLYGDRPPTYVLGLQRLFEIGIHIEANCAGCPAAAIICPVLSSHQRRSLVYPEPDLGLP